MDRIKIPVAPDILRRVGACAAQTLPLLRRHTRDFETLCKLLKDRGCDEVAVPFEEFLDGMKIMIESGDDVYESLNTITAT
jgi:hypothetical protein